MDRIVRDYADAAERMKEAGLDGFELECYGHLLDSFWSPAINNRTDEHGGSLDNRLRFTHRVLDAIRERIGADFIVGLRLVADEDMDKGLSRDEGLEICRRMIATGHVDFLNIIRGHIEHDGPLSRVIPVTGMASAPHLDFAGQVRAETRFPVFHAARINDVATARHAVAEGKLDMVGMTRAHIADPHIARKVMEGREDEVRPCVGATYCLDRIYEGRGTSCVHNAATGREATMPHDIAKTTGRLRHVVVVGAGPAGLEAARVAAERGHKVTVLEAAPQAGGQVRLAAQVKRRSELIGIVDWRVKQLERLGVDVRYNTYAEPDDVTDLEPEVVIIATGGLPREDAIANGAELATSSWDIISGEVSVADDVLMYDDNGAHPGMAATEVILEHDAKLEVVSSERMFAPEIGGLNLVPYIEKLHSHGAQITTMTRIKSLKREGNKISATLVSAYNGETTGERLVDQVVVEYATTPLDDLYFGLKPLSSNGGEIDYEALVAGQAQTVIRNENGQFQLFRIGDAVASRNIHASPPRSRPCRRTGSAACRAPR